MSEPFSAQEAADWTGGRLLRGDPAARLDAVGIDSRSVARGSLFVAIAGERFDGHDFLADALAAGAAGLVIEAGREAPADTPLLIAVENTTRALGALARGHRARFSGPVVAITGSNGKTTTKEMCAAILATAGPYLKNEGNLNNEFGLPLTLLRREPEQKSLVVELGMNHRGEIARLAAIAQPTVGVITNVGTAHIEHLGSREEIALEKGDLVAALGADGVAVLNADDPRVLEQAARTRARVLRFGFSEEAEVRALEVRAEADGHYRFALHCQGRDPVEVRVAGLGSPTVLNALAAAGGALAAGFEPGAIARGLDAYRPVPGRLEPVPLPRGGLLINDTYNANPQSLEVALRTLAQGEPAGARIAVLGDMGELGETGDAAHRAAGELAAKLGVDALFALGERAGLVAEGARAAGMPAEAIFTEREDWESLADRVCARFRAGDRALVKGSRAMRMERIVERLMKSAGEA